MVVLFNMASTTDEDVSSSLKGKKVRSFTVSFELRAIAHAEVHGNRSAARKYDVDERRVREWRAKKESISSLNLTDGEKKRKRVDGGGRKPQFQAVDEIVLDWISNRRERGLRVSRKLIMKKAQVAYYEIKLGETANIANEEEFKASGWLKNFMRRNHLSLRRKTSIAQKTQIVWLLKLFLMFCK